MVEEIDGVGRSLGEFSVGVEEGVGEAGVGVEEARRCVQFSCGIVVVYI